MARYPFNLVKIETDSGLFGIGEAFARQGIMEHIGGMKPLLVGQDPLLVETHWSRMMEIGFRHRIRGRIADCSWSLTASTFPGRTNIVEWEGPLYKSGFLTVPDKPGLGVNLNEEVCRAHLVPGTRFFE